MNGALQRAGAVRHALSLASLPVIVRVRMKDKDFESPYEHMRQKRTGIIPEFEIRLKAEIALEVLGPHDLPAERSVERSRFVAALDAALP